MSNAASLLAIPGFTASASIVQFYTTVIIILYASLGVFIWLKPLEVAKKPYLTWAVLIPCLLVPIWLGVNAWIIAVTLMSIYGFKEFARSTGLYEQKIYCIVVYLFMVMMALSSMGHRYGLFMAI